MNVRRNLWLLMGCLLLMCLAPFSGQAQEAGKSFPPITVVSDDNYPPYIFRDDKGDLQGILVDEWKLWEKKTGIKVILVAMDWDKAQQYLLEGQADVIDTIFFSEERAKRYSFTKPYAKLDVPVFFHKNISGIADIASLLGFTVGVKAGDACIDVLRKQGITSLKVYNSYEEIVKAAADQQIKVFAIDKPPALYYLYKMNLEHEFRYSLNLYTGEFHRAVIKGRTDLLKVVEDGFSQITKAEHDAIEKKWTGESIIKSAYFQYVLYSLIFAGLVSIVLIIFNLILRRKVKSRTSDLQYAINQLKLSEDKYRELIENANSIILKFNLSGHVTFFNEFAQKFFGYSEMEILGQHLVGTIVPETESTGRDLKGMIAEIAAYPERYVNNTNENRCRDGGIVWLAWTNKSIYDEGGRLVEILSVGNDITERKRAEHQLVASEDKFYKAFQANPSLMAIRSLKDGRFIDVNDAYTRATGYTREELLEKVSYKLGIVDRETIRKAQQTIDSRGFIRNFEGAFKTKSGAVRTGLFSAAVIQIEGEPCLLSGLQDITDRKQAEEALRESEDRFRSLIQSSSDMVFIVGKDGQLTYESPSVSRILGYEPGYFIGKSLLTHIHHDDRDQIAKDLDQVSRSVNDSIPAAFRYRNADGVWVYLEALGSNQFDNPGIQGLVLTVRDITERKRTDEQLIRLSLAIERAAEEVMVTDTEGNIQYVNPAFEHITGYTSQEAIGRTPRLLKSGVHDDSFYKNMWKTIAGGDVWKGQVTNKRKNGELIQLDANISSIIDPSGNLLGYISLKRDVTEKLKLERQLIQAQKLEAIGTLAGGMAHNFNNILTVIQGHATLMLMNLDPGHPYYERMKNIEEQVKSGAELTQQILAFARGGQFETKPLDMNAVLSRLAVLFGKTRKEIDMHMRLADGPLPVLADQNQMEQVFLNLFMNASQAMPSGGSIDLVTQSVILHVGDLPYEVVPGPYVKISVTDTGAGMDAKTRERIFEPFFSTKKKGRGTGLGLATVYGIVKGHGGFITVESEIGDGTTFTIYLPVSEKEIVKETIAATEILTGTETILVVDDEKTVLGVSMEYLESLGYRVYGAGSGQEALAVYLEKQKSIDMVILDMVLPGLSGGETFDRLRSINPAVRVLLSSGYSINGQAQQILDRGCNGFLQKPFHLEKLSQKLRDVLKDY